MKGLLLKELFMIRKSGFAFAILSGAFIFSGIFSGEPSILLMIPLFMSIMIFSFLNSDEMSKWGQYSLALPYGRKKIVSSKYSTILILNAFSILVVLSSYFVAVAIGKTEFSAELLFILLIFSVIVGLFYPSIILPLSYKFNTEKSRIIIMIASGVIGGVSAFFMEMQVMMDILDSISEYIYIIIFAAVILLFVGSWFLSMKIYDKKDL